MHSFSIYKFFAAATFHRASEGYFIVHLTVLKRPEWAIRVLSRNEFLGGELGSGKCALGRRSGAFPPEKC